MGSRRRAIVTLLVGACTSCLALTGSAAAQSTNRDLIDSLEYQLLYVALPLTLFVLVILIYAAVKFHDNDDPEPTTEDPALEITWTVATAIILLFVGLSGYSVLVNPYVSPSQALEGDDRSQEGFDSFDDLPETDDEEVHVRGYQWEWQATYPGSNVTTENELVLPADRNVTVWLTSADVVHSLFVPDLASNRTPSPANTPALGPSSPNRAATTRSVPNSAAQATRGWTPRSSSSNKPPTITGSPKTRTPSPTHRSPGETVPVCKS